MNVYILINELDCGYIDVRLINIAYKSCFYFKEFALILKETLPKKIQNYIHMFMGSLILFGIIICSFDKLFCHH